MSLRVLFVGLCCSGGALPAPGGLILRGARIIEQAGGLDVHDLDAAGRGRAPCP